MGKNRGNKYFFRRQVPGPNLDRVEGIVSCGKGINCPRNPRGASIRTKKQRACKEKTSEAQL